MKINNLSRPKVPAPPPQNQMVVPLSLRTVYSVFPIIKHSKILGLGPVPTPGPFDLKLYSGSSSHEGL